MEDVDPRQTFDLAQFGGDHRIAHWEPETRVVFSRPMRISIILAALFLLLGFGSFFLLFAVFDAREVEVGTFTILILLGSVLGGYGFYGFVESWPRTVTFDWNQRKVIWKTLLGKRVTPFSNISEMILQVNVYRGWGGIVVPGPKEYSLSLQIGERWGTTISFSQVWESDPDFELDRIVEKYRPFLQNLACTLALPGRVLHWDGTVLHTISRNSSCSPLEEAL